MENRVGKEPHTGMESSPKHSGYGTDKIGGKGEMVFSRGVSELKEQGKEFHHCVDGNTHMTHEGHEEHVRGRSRESLMPKKR